MICWVVFFVGNIDVDVIVVFFVLFLENDKVIFMFGIFVFFVFWGVVNELIYLIKYGCLIVLYFVNV